MYSSVPLGYNHPIFDESFEYLAKFYGAIKITNCEILTDAAEEFDTTFKNFGSNKNFQHFHYCCTGALAIEAAIKTCIRYKKHSQPKVLTFENSFHGINSYGGFITSRFPAANVRLQGFPEVFSHKINANRCFGKDANYQAGDGDLEEALVEVENALSGNDITGLIFEPIQCSAGDLYADKRFLLKTRELCKKFNVPFVMDEIQTGFGVTGDLWLSDQVLNLNPDIIVFGKKAQTSGIMVKDQVADIFQNVQSLEPTWTGDVMDMIRSLYVMKAIQQHNLLGNIPTISKQLTDTLKDTDILYNVRANGYIIGCDLESEKYKEKFQKVCLDNGLLVNTTGEKSVRLRPNLAFTHEELDDFKTKMKGIVI
jgi:L-lysine 6-transaminase